MRTEEQYITSWSGFDSKKLFLVLSDIEALLSIYIHVIKTNGIYKYINIYKYSYIFVISGYNLTIFRFGFTKEPKYYLDM